MKNKSQIFESLFLFVDLHHSRNIELLQFGLAQIIWRNSVK